MATLMSGVIPALITPTKEDGGIDLDILPEVIEYFLQRRVNGFFILGTAGEWMLLRLEDRMRLIERTVEIVAHRVPVVVHASAFPIDDAIKLARCAEEMRADGISLIPPLYFSFTDRDIFKYFEAIIKAVSSAMPVYLYNIPDFARNAISVEVLSALHAKYSNVVGIKDSQREIEGLIRFRKAVPDGRVMVGNDYNFLEALKAGGDGCVSGNANVLPELFVACREAFKADDLDRARAIQEKISRLATATNYGYIPLLREGLKIRGVRIGPCLPPFSPPTREEVECLAETLDLLVAGLIEERGNEDGKIA